MGISLASDVFNIQTDLAFEPLMETSFGLLKCVDDVAFSSSSKTGLYKKAKQFFDFCRKYNKEILFYSLPCTPDHTVCVLFDVQTLFAYRLMSKLYIFYGLVMIFIYRQFEYIV